MNTYFPDNSTVLASIFFHLNLTTIFQLGVYHMKISELLNAMNIYSSNTFELC
jgi:hypothetical protein